MNHLLLIFSAVFLLSNCSHAPQNDKTQTISLRNDSSSPKHPRIFDKDVKHIPHFSVDQYHPGLNDLFTGDGSSMLCMPALVSTLLIQKYIEDKKFETFSLAGLDKANATVDANALVRQLLPCLKFSKDKDTGTKTRNTANCLSDLGKQNNTKLDIKLISAPGAKTALNPEIKQIEKLPDFSDIKNYVDQGYKVIAGVDFFYESSEGKLKSDLGHYVAIYGYAYRKSWAQDFLHVYITDPSFYFWKSMPKAHLALFTRNPTLKLPEWTSNINIKSPTLGSLKNEVFLTELLIFK